MGGWILLCVSMFVSIIDYFLIRYTIVNDICNNYNGIDIFFMILPIINTLELFIVLFILIADKTEASSIEDFFLIGRKNKEK